MVDVWKKLSTHYQSKPKVIFGIMNEPHDITIKIWVNVLQNVVDGIRQSGSTQHDLLLPGNNWSHLKTFAQDYSAGMSSIKNPDGSQTGLLFEIHQVGFRLLSLFSLSLISSHLSSLGKP